MFSWLITVWLWLTVIFANLAEAVAEGRGKAQAETLRKTRTETQLAGCPAGSSATRRRRRGGVSAAGLQLGDHVVVEAGASDSG